MGAKGSQGSDGKAPILFTFEPNYDGIHYRLYQIHTDPKYDNEIVVENIGDFLFKFQFLENVDNTFGRYITLWMKQID